MFSAGIKFRHVSFSSQFLRGTRLQSLLAPAMVEDAPASSQQRFEGAVEFFNAETAKWQAIDVHVPQLPRNLSDKNTSHNNGRSVLVIGDEDKHKKHMS